MKSNTKKQGQLWSQEINILCYLKEWLEKILSYPQEFLADRGINKTWNKDTLVTNAYTAYKIIIQTTLKKRMKLNWIFSQIGFWKRTSKSTRSLKIALRHRCSPVNLLYIFRTPFPKNTSGRLLLKRNLWTG